MFFLKVILVVVIMTAVVGLIDRCGKFPTDPHRNVDD